jgi:acyl-[acyl carrier protein]--UDP-N-acetylglucosamine O-acyltransferase
MGDAQNDKFIHSTAIVEPGAIIGKGVKIWHFAHVRGGATLSDFCSLGRDCYVEAGVHVGRGASIQNGVSLYSGVILKDYVFVGPHVVFTNDMFPRAGTKKWNVVATMLDIGSSVGAGVIVRCGVALGAFSMCGAGALVTKDIAPFTLATGFPAKPVKKICACGRTKTALDSNKWSAVESCCSEFLKPELIDLALSIGQQLKR